MGSTVIAGRPSNTVGDKDSALVLRGSSIKIQWGNKFIDLLKNGKINVEVEKILKVSDSVDNITSDGVYLIEDQVWVSIEGTKIQLSGNSENTYISFLTDQKEITAEQKQRALTNIGFYYETLEDVENAGLTAGLIYVQGTNKIYIVKDGVISEYVMQVNSSPIVMGEEDLQDKIVQGLYIEGTSLKLNRVPYITCDLNQVITHKQLIVENGLYSDDAAENKGFKLYNLYGESYLEVDNIIERNNKTTTKVTHSELLSLIESKKLMPKQYYIITDFQNPWEVSWEDEELFYEDTFEEINNISYQTGRQNAMQLIAQARNYDSIYEQVWSLDNPDWIIYYDPFYRGFGHNVIITDEEGNQTTETQYGFRYRIQDDITTYLPCKGQITYLKDHQGNEGSFNFRQFQFRQNVDSWRCCINYDNSEALGSFFDGAKNNKFFFTPYTYLQVFVFEPVLNEEGKVVKYEMVVKDSGEPPIIKGHELFVTVESGFESVSDNVFELGDVVDDSLTHYITTTNLVSNKFINIKKSMLIAKNIVNNTFQDIYERLEIANTCTSCNNNIIKNLKVPLKIDDGTLNNNKLSNFIGDCLFDNSSIFSGNIINHCNSTISNAGDFRNNTIDSIYSPITNEGGFQSNIIESIQADNVFKTSATQQIVNNTFGIISGKFDITENFSNNIVGDISECFIHGVFLNNKFKNLSNITINAKMTNNVVEGNITGVENFSVSGEFTNNIVHKDMNGFIMSDKVDKCVFLQQTDNLTLSAASNSTFEYISNMDFSEHPIHWATFHGSIKGGELLTTEPVDADWDLLANETQYKDVYPNIRIVQSGAMRGMIVMWHGSTPIPFGWAICNGENGTPNLIDKFIKGSAESGGTGGNVGNMVTLSEDNIPQHTHNVALTTSENGDYEDTIDYNSNTISSGYSDNGGYNIEYTYDNSDHILNIQETTEAITIDHSAHTHSVEGTTKEEESVDVKPFSIEPEYYALIFIMKL